MEDLKTALEGLELTEDEWQLIEWIASWGRPTVMRFVYIIRKCRNQKDGTELD